MTNEKINYINPLSKADNLLDSSVKVTGVYQETRDDGKKVHQGLDYRASAGTSVYAAADGIVIKAGKTTRKFYRSIFAAITTLAILLISVKSNALDNKDERNLDHYLKHYLKIKDYDLKSHKEVFYEMNQHKQENKKLKESDKQKKRKGLINDIAIKYNLNPSKKGDYCIIMERVLFYLASMNDLMDEKSEFCDVDSYGCVRYYPVFDQYTDENNDPIKLYIISDYKGVLIGIWSYFKEDHGRTIENVKYFRINQGRNNDNSFNLLGTVTGNLNNKNDASYLEVDGCHIKELRIKPN